MEQAPIGPWLRSALARTPRRDRPYPHWLPSSVLPASACSAIVALPFVAPSIGDTLGKRETHNTQRIFVSVENRGRFPVCAGLADALQAPETVGLLERMTGAALAGSSLRIECCLDTDGFWLEPHTDIGAKLLTFLVYLSDHPDAADWGTDIMDRDGNVFARVPGTYDDGLIFVPAADTWHGFARRRIAGVRKSLIVNYVKPEWRSRHELAFPDRPVVALG